MHQNDVRTLKVRGQWSRNPKIGSPARISRGLTGTIAIATLMTVAVTLAACSSGSSATSTTATSGAPSGPASTAGGRSAAPTIDIKNFTFLPKSITVAPGATVTVTNQDAVAHTITATKGGFNTGDIAPGQSKTFTAPNTAGTYPYICNIHQYMTGMLKVS